MTDKTDPRVEGLLAAFDASTDGGRRALWFAPDEWLAAIDAADCAADIVRVDTRDEALVERIATAERKARASYWDATTPAERAATGVDGVSRHVARAVLAALREAL